MDRQPLHRRALLVALYGATVIATLGGFEAWLSLASGIPPETSSAGSYHDGGYFVEHPILGYAPKPDVTVTSSKRVAGELLYDVSYTIDENGLRRTAPPTATPTRSIVFFGCSMTFGEGLEDDETAAALVAQAVGDRFRVYNFGFHGYGPQHMLAAIEGGLVEKIVREPPARVVFQTFSGHLERSAGRATWDQNGPRYRLRPDGGIERQRRDAAPSPFTSAVHEVLERFAIYRRTVGSERPIRSEDVDLLAGIVATARDQIHARYPAAEVRVVLWGRTSDDRAEQIAAALAERDVPVRWVRDFLPGYEDDPRPYQLSPFDKHPNAAAQRYIARDVVESVEAKPVP